MRTEGVEPTVSVAKQPVNWKSVWGIMQAQRFSVCLLPSQHLCVWMETWCLHMYIYKTAHCTCVQSYSAGQYFSSKHLLDAWWSFTSTLFATVSPMLSQGICNGSKRLLPQRIVNLSGLLQMTSNFWSSTLLTGITPQPRKLWDTINISKPLLGTFEPL